MRENWGDATIEWGSAEVEPGIRIHHGVAVTEGMMREVAEDVSFRTIERANHWVHEENAEGLVDAIKAFAR